ncbi:alpha/beta fold hydrolase [Thalassotalea atypica]|uniref:alpha/beta fold hydrolase n=1 Tax=Thalassotalea atypica TaxID=2054316 RepID=UPI0025725EE4|nr:alpha/beta fold hydrolase [Thalassotalea atypica]
MTLLNFNVLGEGTPLILIHGLLGSLDNLGMVAKPLSEKYQIISVDVRNHGDSFHKSSMKYTELAQDVINVLEHLNIKRAHILGHSMGGKIAMQIALTFPAYVEKLIVADIAPVAYPPHHQQILTGLKALDLPSLTSRKEADLALSHYVKELGVRQFLLRNLTTKDGKLSFKCNLDNIINCYPHIAEGFADDQNFTGQTLFIKGGNSDYITAAHREIVGAYFPSSKAKIIAGAGHWLHAEKTIAFNKIVQDFLSS